MMIVWNYLLLACTYVFYIALFIALILFIKCMLKYLKQ